MKWSRDPGAIRKQLTKKIHDIGREKIRNKTKSFRRTIADADADANGRETDDRWAYEKHLLRSFAVN